MSAFWVVTALGLAPSPASAQTIGASITIVTGTQATQLVDSNHNPVTHAFVSDQPFWVNLAECKLGWQYQVSVTTVGVGSTTMEVWAGATSSDCSQYANRFVTQVGNPTCWRVGIFNVTDGTWAYYIPVQNVVAQLATTDAASTSAPTGTAADCTRIAQGLTQEAGVAINLNFYIFSGGTTSGTPTYSAVWGNAGYDLVGPSAPTTVSVRPADTELYVNWSQVLDTDLAGYHIYCRQPDGNAPGIDGGVGTGGTATTSTGGASNTGGAAATGGSAVAGNAGTAGTSNVSDAGLLYNQSCPDSVLFEGALPGAGMSLKGTVSDKLATSGIATGLNNGTSFVCAVSGYDTRQNDGPLSVVQCGTAWWVNDFFSTYRNSGGKAGGGFCNIGFGHGRAWYLIPLASVLMLALRRRRSKS